ncbi:hypothetical protein R3W88_014638 [Solanum pinnatisectum]|uniref:Uncharacterized protein n=1 Tax=Solanum pinnatisectum TaxID=50273 RepID=A0AAV9KVC3_9SOLN|nr:hypothetical protein R3W88_014638 [Solanum pinnatisectum]
MRSAAGVGDGARWGQVLGWARPPKGVGASRGRVPQGGGVSKGVGPCGGASGHKGRLGSGVPALAGFKYGLKEQAENYMEDQGQLLLLFMNSFKNRRFMPLLAVVLIESLTQLLFLSIPHEIEEELEADRVNILFTVKKHREVYTNSVISKSGRMLDSFQLFASKISHSQFFQNITSFDEHRQLLPFSEHLRVNLQLYSLITMLDAPIHTMNCSLNLSLVISPYSERNGECINNFTLTIPQNASSSNLAQIGHCTAIGIQFVRIMQQHKAGSLLIGRKLPSQSSPSKKGDFERDVLVPAITVDYIFNTLFSGELPCREAGKIAIFIDSRSWLETVVLYLANAPPPGQSFHQNELLPEYDIEIDEHVPVASTSSHNTQNSKTVIYSRPLIHHQRLDRQVSTPRKTLAKMRLMNHCNQLFRHNLCFTRN